MYPEDDDRFGPQSTKIRPNHSLPIDWREWTRAVKKPNPVIMWQMSENFEVDTDSGVQYGQKGDWLVHDPMSGGYWPITDRYKVMHYDEIEHPKETQT